MHRVSPPLSRRAFTLVELLIVIAIIVLLAAILFPAFASVREKARQSTCASNLKQIGSAILLYTQDYDERYPTVYVDGENNMRDFWDVCQPYIKSDEIFHCPSDDSEECDPLNGCTKSGKELSYGVNSGPLYVYGEPSKVFPQGGIYSEGSDSVAYGGSLASDVTPSRSFLAADAFDVFGHTMAIDRYRRATPAAGRNSAWRHGNWRNVLYCDGHVKMVRWRSGWIGDDEYRSFIMLPHNKADYESYCLDTDKKIPNWWFGYEEQSCGDVAGQVASLTNWSPD